MDDKPKYSIMWDGHCIEGLSDELTIANVKNFMRMDKKRGQTITIYKSKEATHEDN